MEVGNCSVHSLVPAPNNSLNRSASELACYRQVGRNGVVRARLIRAFGAITFSLEAAHLYWLGC